MNQPCCFCWCFREGRMVEIKGAAAAEERSRRFGGRGR